MDAPPRSLGFGRKVCEEAGVRGAKLGEREPAFGLLQGSHWRPLRPRAAEVS